VSPCVCFSFSPCPFFSAMAHSLTFDLSTFDLATVELALDHSLAAFSAVLLRLQKFVARDDSTTGERSQNRWS
jgi:hypothetical protein